MRIERVVTVMNVLVNKVILSPNVRSVLPCRHVLGRVLVVEAPHVPRNSYSSGAGAGLASI